ncbi:hypothetical protein J4H86_03805 [Spiractinospora alimapuensis]|uniref:hypothetical protein n=1 Tax=Spiractinospora alimapuensis TaxID=2820884 RepID=UPI001F3183B0|nr:hypothetical protein [Spiractinospora alimapuensis]QVQ52950.1 hypothetical protein J4H86_03805 [Spiractinospora alimapuensis]
MGAIADLVRPELAIAIVSAYLFLRVAPQAARMFSGRKTLEIERRNETTTTDALGELNESRLRFNAQAQIYLDLETDLSKKQLSNGKLENKKGPLEEGVKTAEDAITTLDSIIDHVDPKSSAAFSPDGTARIKIEVPEQAKSAPDAAPESEHTIGTATRRHLGLPPTTADKLLTSEPTPPRNDPPARQQSGPKEGKDNGRAR